ncbi:MAG: ArsR/SmtB family transcription factor [Candidatus Dormibacteria bacterium]
MNAVFAALSDPTRRDLLDELFREDGRTLTALASTREMTRFGVMKHLRVLEDAGLVVTRRRGREKLHFLNPVPIRLIHDRWVSKYAQPWSAALVDLKRTLEEHAMETTTLDTTQEDRAVEKVFEIYIKATPQRVWDAITSPEVRARFTFGVSMTSDWTQGSRFEQHHAKVPGTLLGDGVNLEVVPPRRLVQSARFYWSDEVRGEAPTRVTWEIEPVGEDSCMVKVTHDQIPEGASAQIYGGWPMMLSGLKTWLETGETLTTPGSLMYA